MARSTPEEIRRRIAKRKKEYSSTPNSTTQQIAWPGVDETDSFQFSSSDRKDDGPAGHPLFKKEVFFFKILASVLLFLTVAILFRNHTATFDPARKFVSSQMDKDFKFATVSNWYESKFGKPLALLPFSDDKSDDQKQVVDGQNFSVPAMGKILENFEKNGQGIMIETGKGAAVQAIDDGQVTFAGKKEGLGNTVIIRHADDSQTWYGNLADIKVSPYEYIEKRTVVGTVSTSTGEDKTKGNYYFAIKKGDDFIDPNQVIRFE